MINVQNRHMTTKYSKTQTKLDFPGSHSWPGPQHVARYIWGIKELRNQKLGFRQETWVTLNIHWIPYKVLVLRSWNLP